MSERRPVSETDLNAYVDGFLDETERRRVEEHLAENPEAARASSPTGRRRTTA